MRATSCEFALNEPQASFDYWRCWLLLHHTFNSRGKNSTWLHRAIICSFTVGFALTNTKQPSSIMGNVMPSELLSAKFSWLGSFWEVLVLTVLHLCPLKKTCSGLPFFCSPSPLLCPSHVSPPPTPQIAGLRVLLVLLSLFYAPSVA